MFRVTSLVRLIAQHGDWMVLEQREGHRYRWVILFSAFVASMAGPLVLFSAPPLFGVLTVVLHASLSEINAAAMTSFGLGMILMAIPFAIICTATISAGALITVLSTSVQVLAFGRFLGGIGLGMAFTWPTGAMSAWFSREEMGLAMGIWSTTLPHSGLCIFILGSLMIAAQGWTSVLWFTFLWAVGTLLIWIWLAKSPTYAEGVPWNEIRLCAVRQVVSGQHFSIATYGLSVLHGLP